MVSALLDELASLTQDRALDFAIVVPERDRFEALQRHRRRALEPSDGDLALALGHRARQGDLSLMIGAGVSMGAGLPSWNGLLAAVAAKVPDPDRAMLLWNEAPEPSTVMAPDEQRTTPTFSSAFQSLPALDQAQLLEALMGTSLGQEVVASITKNAEGKKRRPALGHLLLAGVQCRQVATTNYDDLYETAVRSQQGGGIAKLPYERPTHGQPWILKMHGDVEHEQDIVLTRTSFIAYDGRHRPAGSLFQSMLMTSHVLFVGVSLTDDNILRLTHEVAHYVNASLTAQAPDDEDRGLLGTVLTLAPDPHRERLWAGSLDWSTRGNAVNDDTDNARQLEILLDDIAMWAVADASHGG